MATGGIGGSQFNKNALADKLEELQRQGQGDKDVRLKVTKNGQFEVRADSAKGRFGRLSVITGAARQKTLKEQLVLAKWVGAMSGNKTLEDRKVLTVSDALKELRQAPTPEPYPAPSQPNRQAQRATQLPPQVPPHQGRNAHINQHHNPSPSTSAQIQPQSQPLNQPPRQQPQQASLQSPSQGQ